LVSDQYQGDQSIAYKLTDSTNILLTQISSLLDQQNRDDYILDIEDEYETLREEHYATLRERKYLPLSKAREKGLKIDFKKTPTAVPKKLGVHV
jgi:5-methyltetrahydrofolate--homocysteine methyltransferase